MIKKLLIGSALLLSSLTSFGDNGWSSAWEPSKVFIENKGQFPKVNNQNIEFVIDNDRTKIYFSATGLTYSFFKSAPKDNEEEEREREKEGRSKIKSTEDWLAMEREEHKANLKFDYVHLTWDGANTNCKIIAEEEVK